jgi:4-phospho-D-threonate 3-dehydrogenase / 4-phospho-D-erythronate 3-dehydrogenase
MVTNAQLPVIGITMGDPVGIGPEIIAKVLADPELQTVCRPVIFGDRRVIAHELHKLGSSKELQPCATFARSMSGPYPELIAVSALDPTEVVPGRPTPATSAAMASAIIEAVRYARAGEIDAIVTAPINKQALNQAGYDYPGHTEMLAHLTGASDVVMMLAGERLRVVLVTIHCALADVPGRLSIEAIAKVATTTNTALKRYFTRGTVPRIAIAGLNPHAGENALFGCEEQTIIGPAIEHLRAQGLNVSGPHPPDTVFYAAARGDYDVVVCMYHDQGLIPLKLLHFEDGVNITLGLPIIRTSVDHGTAYDIAGRGLASPASLLSALKTAASMACANR